MFLSPHPSPSAQRLGCEAYREYRPMSAGNRICPISPILAFPNSDSNTSSGRLREHQLHTAWLSCMWGELGVADAADAAGCS